MGWDRHPTTEELPPPSQGVDPWLFDSACTAPLVQPLVGTLPIRPPPIVPAMRPPRPTVSPTVAPSPVPALTAAPTAPATTPDLVGQPFGAQLFARDPPRPQVRTTVLGKRPAPPEPRKEKKSKRPTAE